MTLTVDNSGAVLAGRSLPPEDLMKVQKVRVLRPFYFNRELQKKDAVVELPVLFAAECCAAKKVEYIDEAVSAPVPATEGGKGKAGGATAKEQAHAGK